MKLRNRIICRPRSAIGDLWGSPEDAARNIAYWRKKPIDED